MAIAVSKPARMLAAGAVSLGLTWGGAMAVAPTSDAAMLSSAQRTNVIKIAASKKGTPYRWGATGPSAFDCSGYTKWVFARAGKKLPRTANDQYRATLHISKRSARPGDLVFFGGSRKTHVGIYAGNGMMWHSPHSGSTVRLAKVYSSKAVYGRVR